MAKKHHPDLNGGKQSNEFKEMTNAYDILSDVEKKKQYDAMRKGTNQPNSFYTSSDQKTGFNGFNNTTNSSNQYYNENFEQKIREKFRRAGFDNEKFSKFKYKDPKTGEWKSYGNAQGNPFFKDFEDLFQKASNAQQTYKQQQTKSNYSQNSYNNNFSAYESQTNKQDTFGSESKQQFKGNRNEQQFSNEDLNDPNRFSNMGYNPFNQNTKSNDSNYNSSNANSNYNSNKTNINDGGNYNKNSNNIYGKEPDFNNFNYDYTPILLKQFARRAVIVLSFFFLMSILYKKKARDDYYFNNGLGNAGVNQGYYAYSEFVNNPHGGIVYAKKKKKKEEQEEEVDAYDEHVNIKVK